MHHKRGRPKSRRSGCLLCKPHKGNHCGHTGKHDGLNMRNVRRRTAAVEALKEISGMKLGTNRPSLSQV